MTSTFWSRTDDHTTVLIITHSDGLVLINSTVELCRGFCIGGNGNGGEVCLLAHNNLVFEVGVSNGGHRSQDECIHLHNEKNSSYC
jgi:hypothetical protein